MAYAEKFLATDETLLRVAVALENGVSDVPIATTATAGKVKPDGDSISVALDGTIAASCISTTTTDPGEGSALATGKLLVVLEAD